MANNARFGEDVSSLFESLEAGDTYSEETALPG